MMAVCVAGLPLQPAIAQSTTPAASQEDNPFPGEPAKTPAAAPQAAQPAAKPGASAAKPGKESDNPFPGEDPGAPIIPVGPPDSRAAGSSRAPSNAGADAGDAGTPDPDGDPVRSPDGRAHVVDDGFSSSRSGLDDLPVEDTTDRKAGESVKVKTREQVIKEDVDVGGFYLSVKNWKAADERFKAAFALDREDPDAVWGLAEAERHLNLLQEAREHYTLFLSYDPDGPHSKEARKALEQVQAALPAAVPR